MNILLLIPFFILFLIPAYAETIPVSIVGHEITGEEDYKMWLEFDDLEIKSAKFSLIDFSTDPETPIIFDLPNPKYSTDNTNEKYDEIWGETYGKTFTVLSQLTPTTSVLFNGEYIDEDTVLIDGKISFQDKKSIDKVTIIQLQYIATVTNKEINTAQ